MNIKKWLLNTGFIFLLEFIFYVSLFSNIDLYLIYILLFSSIIGSIITLISSIGNKKITNIINGILNIFITIIFIAQLIHFRFYHSVFSLYSMLNGGQVFDFFGAILKVILNNIINLLVLIIPLILYFILNKKIEFNKPNCKNIFIQIISTIIILIITLISLNLDSDKMYNSKDLYKDIHAPTFMVKKFGLLTTMRLDIERAIFGFDENLESITNTENSKDNTSNITQTIEYNTLEIDFDKLIEEESNEKIKNLHSYFSQATPTEKNEYTGIFKDKNLIVLVAEAFSPIAIDKDVTPTLYKLYNEGFKFNNFYSPIFYVSTSDGEYVTLTSLLPKEGVWSFQESSKISLPFTYGNLFKNYGYTARAYHNGVYTYYKRNLSHPNMGYKYQGCWNGLEKKINCKIWPQSDLEMINKTFDDYKNDDKFITYYMTISGHLNYNFYGNMMALKNKNKVTNLPYSEAVKAYMATHIELDNALKLLIEKLEKENKLDDTVIVISADHYPYGLSDDELKEKANYIKDDKFDIHKNSFIIWNSQIDNPKETDKYSSSLDILPTVLNLFGIDYDSRLLMGTDIFSSSPGLVIYNDRSWITEYGKYNALTQKFTQFKELEDKDAYIKSINNIVYNKFSISRSILENNYYKYLNLR